ncbi:MAG: BON domain-containing protein [Armatimonadetes bacterium]|nr:BON domain-containing protein [Armatimonadota bacterium]
MRHWHRAIRGLQGLAAAMLCGAALAGCAKPADPSTSGPEASTSRPDVVAANDGKLKSDLEAKFKADPVLAKAGIKVEVKDGRVILSGQVAGTDVKVKAEDTARAMPDAFGVSAEGLVAKQ